MVNQLNASVFDYPCCDGGVTKRLGASLHSLSGPAVGRDKLKAGGQDFGPDGLVFVVIKGFLVLFGLCKSQKFTLIILWFVMWFVIQNPHLLFLSVLCEFIMCRVGTRRATEPLTHILLGEELPPE